MCSTGQMVDRDAEITALSATLAERAAALQEAVATGDTERIKDLNEEMTTALHRLRVLERGARSVVTIGPRRRERGT